MSLTALGKRLDGIEFIIAPDGEPVDYKFFAVFVGVSLREGEYFETYVDVDPAPWSPIGEHQHCYPEDLDQYESQGIHCMLLFDPSRCDWRAYMSTRYYSTPAGTPEREQEQAAHAAAWPECLEEHLYLWRDVRPGGQFLEIVKQRDQNKGAEQRS